MSNIPAERLREGEQILVRGKVSFSRLSRLVEGDALTKSIEQARSRGQLYPTIKPHTTISLVDAQILAANPAEPTQEEQFVQQKVHTIKSGDNAGKAGFSIDNVSTFLPTVLEQDPENPGQYRQLVLERDLATGIEVTLVLQVFKPKGYEKRGLGLQQVVLNEAVRYFASGVDTSVLAARGIVVNGAIRAVTADSSATATGPIATAAAPIAEPGVVVPANTQADAHGYAMPTPGAQGVVPTPSLAQQAFPQSAPVQAQPAQPAAYTAPPQQPRPVQQVAQPAAAPVETPEQQIARLQQQLAESAAAMASSGGNSPFDAAPEASNAPAAGPWDVPVMAGAAYQG